MFAFVRTVRAHRETLQTYTTKNFRDVVSASKTLRLDAFSALGLPPLPRGVVLSTVARRYLALVRPQHTRTAEWCLTVASLGKRWTLHRSFCARCTKLPASFFDAMGTLADTFPGADGPEVLEKISWHQVFKWRPSSSSGGGSAGNEASNAERVPSQVPEDCEDEEEENEEEEEEDEEEEELGALKEPPAKREVRMCLHCHRRLCDPVRLECGHSLCFACVLTLIRARSFLLGGVKDGEMPCPGCNKRVRVPKLKPTAKDLLTLSPEVRDRFVKAIGVSEEICARLCAEANAHPDSEIRAQLRDTAIVSCARLRSLHTRATSPDSTVTLEAFAATCEAVVAKIL